MKECDTCSSLPVDMKGMGLKDLPDLKKRLQIVSDNAMEWRSVFRCEDCDLHWEEYYETTGHGEVPNLRKVEAGS